jgi:hypothetical protein
VVDLAREKVPATAPFFERLSTSSAHCFLFWLIG